MATVLLACGANAAPTLRVSLGYNRNVRADTWTTARVVVENRGAAVKYEVVAWDDSSIPRVLCRRAFDMPARTRLTLPMYLRPPNSESVTFELRRGDQVVAKERIAHINFISRNELFVLGLADGERSFSVTRRSGVPWRVRFHSAIYQMDIPERWFGYDAIDAVAVASPPYHGFNTAQRQALNEYVAAGGVLLLSPGDDADWLFDDTFDALNPVEIIAPRMLSDVSPLTNAFGEWPNPPERISMWEVRPVRGEVLLWAGQHPLVVAAPYGAGQVVFSAVDLSHELVRGWIGLEDFYVWLLNRRDPLNRLGQTDLRDSAPELLSGLVGARVAGPWLVALLMAVDLALVCAALWYMRRRGRLELGFGIACVIAPVFALVAYGLGGMLSGVSQTAVGSLSIARSGAGSAVARVTTLSGLISPDGAEATMRSANDATAAFWPVQKSGYDPRAMSVERPPVTFEDNDIKTLSRISLEPRWLLPVESVRIESFFGTVDGMAVPGPDGIRVRVRNQSSRTLRDVFVACNRNLTAVEDLTPGDEAAVTLKPGSAVPSPSAFSRNTVKGERELMRDCVLKALFSRSLAFQYDDRVHLYGWVDDARSGSLVKTDASETQRRGETLWIISLPWGAPGGGDVLLPKGSLRIIPPTQLPNYQGGEWRPIMSDLNATLVFCVPEALRRMAPTRMDAWLVSGGVPTKRTVALWNRTTERWDSFGVEDKKVSVPNPAAYYEPTTGSIRAQMKMMTIGDDGASLRERLPWVEDLDIEIEGRMP